MKRKLTIGFTIVLILSVVYFVFNYGSSDKRQIVVIEAGALRTEMIKSIKNPFPQGDTLVLDTMWVFCENSSPYELPVIFDTQFGDMKYKKLFIRQFNIPVVSSEEFSSVMDTILKYKFHNNYPESLWDSCRVGKVAADIKAESLSYNKVILHEIYMYNEKRISISKAFTYNKGKWTFTQMQDNINGNY